MGPTRALSTGHTEDTGNQPGGGSWAQRAQTTRQTWGTHIGALSTVHTEATDNQSDKSTLVGTGNQNAKTLHSM